MTASPLSFAKPAPSLVALLTQQRDLYRQLKLLSDEQATLITDGHTDRLLTLLAQRQRLVDTLTSLNRDLVVARQGLGASDQGARDRVRLLMDEVDVLLQQIIEQDDRDRQSLQSAQQQVANQLKGVRQGGAALSAYRPSIQPGPRFTDRQG